jgi:hypothetical protein
MKTLPTEYIVKCNTEQETSFIANEIKGINSKYNWRHWRYVYITPLRTKYNILFEVIEEDVTNLPIIQFKDWKELYFNEFKEEPARYTKEEILKAGEIGEVSMIDVKHVVSLLDEAREKLKK